jgi:hypothetical protein
MSDLQMIMHEASKLLEMKSTQFQPWAKYCEAQSGAHSVSMATSTMRRLLRCSSGSSREITIVQQASNKSLTLRKFFFSFWTIRIWRQRHAQ